MNMARNELVCTEWQDIVIDGVRHRSPEGDLLGNVEHISERQWRAVSYRHSPGRGFIDDLGTFPTREQARAAIRIRALLLGDRAGCAIRR
jgi:hypothetical protein